MKFFLYCLFLSFVTSLDAEEVDAEWLSIHQVAAENIDPFYKDLRSSHQYVLGLTQIMIYVVPENSSECVVRPIDNAFSDEE